MIRKTGKYLWMFMALTCATTFSYADEGSNIVAAIYNDVLTEDQLTSRIEPLKSFAILFRGDFDEQKRKIGSILAWAKGKAADRLEAKYSLEATGPEIAAEAESWKEEVIEQGLLEEVKEIKYNEKWKALLKKAVCEVHPSGEILIQENAEEKVKEAFEHHKSQIKDAWPERDESDLYTMFKTMMWQFRRPQEVDEYFSALPDSWEDSLAKSHRGFMNDILTYKLKERLLFERVGELNYSMFERYVKAVSKDKALGLKERGEQLPKFLSRFTDYVLEDTIFNELKENLKIYDKNTEKLFWQQYQVPSLDFYIEKLPAEYGK